MVLREATKTYVVKADFKAVLPQELSVRAGDRVRVAGESGSFHATPHNMLLQRPHTPSQWSTPMPMPLAGSWCMRQASLTGRC